MLDLNTDNPEKLKDMPHLNSLDLSCGMKLCKTTHRSRKSIQILFSGINHAAEVCHRGLEVFLRIVLIIISIPFCF